MKSFQELQLEKNSLVLMIEEVLSQYGILEDDMTLLKDLENRIFLIQSEMIRQMLVNSKFERNN